MPKNIKIGKWLTELFKERWTFLLHSLFIAGDVFNFDTKLHFIHHTQDGSAYTVVMETN